MTETIRLQSKKTVTVRGRVIGGADVLICLPLVARDKPTLLEQARAHLDIDPDLLEWRVDAYDRAEDLQESLNLLAELRSAIGTVPLIFTCRIEAEGGYRQIDQKARQALVNEAVKSGHIDIVDAELCNETDFLNEMIQTTRESSVNLVLSYHNFQMTPDEQVIYGKLARAEAMGADIAKVAVMPTGYRDVLTLLNATLKARETLHLPLVTMAMGRLGRVTRLAGGLFGSDITFASGGTDSAPGQVPVDELRKALAVLYPIS